MNTSKVDEIFIFTKFFYLYEPNAISSDRTLRICIGNLNLKR